MSNLRGGRISRAAVSFVTAAARFLPFDWKRLAELYYWRVRGRREGVLSNEHYRYYYTSHFGLTERDYCGKTVLDIGCGPRGSLEWATIAARRIGLDPLADEYRRLGTSRHAMEYLAAPAEAIPLPNFSCDIVCAFNCLDHVDDIAQAIVEIKRITRPGGICLLIVEVNHPPTVTEPHLLTGRLLVSLLGPEFVCEDLRMYRPVASGAYDSIAAGEPFDNPMIATEIGWLSGRFRREQD